MLLITPIYSSHERLEGLGGPGLPYQNVGRCLHKILNVCDNGRVLSSRAACVEERFEGRMDYRMR